MTTIDENFNPGSKEEYVPFIPDDDSPYTKQFTRTINSNKGGYVRVRDHTRGELIGRVSSINCVNGEEFFLQTADRGFYCVRYDNVTNLGVRRAA